MSDSEERRAGSVIFKDLALLNKAIILYDKMHLEVCAAISHLVSEWMQRHAWSGEVVASDHLSDLWVCPDSWKEKGEEPFAHFKFCERPGIDTRSLVIADLCGVGQTGWGFKFEANHSWFGGRTGWNTYVRGIGELGGNIAKKGWINEGRGVFFRPVALRAELLAGAWESEDWGEALAPVGQALDALLADQDLFNQLIKRPNPTAQ